MPNRAGPLDRVKTIVERWTTECLGLRLRLEKLMVAFVMAWSRIRCVGQFEGWLAILGSEPSEWSLISTVYPNGYKCHHRNADS
jgi:hypothetical protein